MLHKRNKYQLHIFLFFLFLNFIFWCLVAYFSFVYWAQGCFSKIVLVVKSAPGYVESAQENHRKFAVALLEKAKQICASHGVRPNLLILNLNISSNFLLNYLKKIIFYMKKLKKKRKIDPKKMKKKRRKKIHWTKPIANPPPPALSPPTTPSTLRKGKCYFMMWGGLGFFI